MGWMPWNADVNYTSSRAMNLMDMILKAPNGGDCPALLSGLIPVSAVATRAGVAAEAALPAQTRVPACPVVTHRRDADLAATSENALPGDV